MQIVIEIDADEYNNMKSLPFTIFAEDIIINGIPLPKGHGDLKDAAEIERLWQKGDYDSLVSALIFGPTVIEADKAGDTDGNSGNDI